MNFHSGQPRDKVMFYFQFMAKLKNIIGYLLPPTPLNKFPSNALAKRRLELA